MVKAKGLLSKIPMAIGANNKPEANALNPRFTCNFNGSKKGIPPKPKRDNKLPKAEIRNVLTFSNSVLIIGCFCRRE